MKNSLYTACKMGNKDDLKNLLAVFLTSLPVKAFVESKNAEIANTAANDLTKDTNTDRHCREEVKEKSLGDKVDEMTSGIIVVQQSSSESASERRKMITNQKHDEDNGSKNMEEVENNMNKTKVEPFKDNVKLSNCGKEMVLDIDSNVSNIGNMDENLGNNCETYVKSSNKECDLKETNSCIGKETADSSENDTDTIIKGIEENQSEHVNDVSKVEKIKSGIKIPGVLGKAPVLEDMSPVVTIEMLSEPFGDNNTTLLHVAAKEGHVTVVTMLMEAGASPAVR